MEYKEYESKLGNIRIEYKIIENKNEAWMDYINYEPEYIKLFLLTLKNSIEDLKKKGIRRIIQKTSCKDWDEYLKKEDNWIIKERNEYYNYCIIECNIENIFKCIAQGLGVYENHTEYKTIIE